MLYVVFFFIKFPSPHLEGRRDGKPLGFKEIIKNKLVILYIVSIGFYVFSEVGVANWFSNYLITTYEFNKDKSSYYLAVFFGIFAFGRLMGGFIVERIGHFKALIAFIITALVLFILGLLGGRNFIYLISISGFFFSIVFPTLLLTINEVFQGNASCVLGTIMTFASSINMVLNLLLGISNDYIGPSKSFFIIPVSLFISLMALLLIVNQRNKNS